MAVHPWPTMGPLEVQRLVLDQPTQCFTEVAIHILAPVTWMLGMHGSHQNRAQIQSNVNEV